ncbi:MAG: hypothetical protein LBI14_04770 [Treponema sp.]|jgi:hypothetical protein|nr:hypothetical protein [Treponema sp.]
MINIEAEVNKHKNCKERDKLGMIIKGYKDLALQHANDLSVAGKYSAVALKLQEICDKLPAPNLRGRTTGNTQSVSTKTATITNEENARIKNAWNQKTTKR